MLALFSVTVVEPSSQINCEFYYGLGIFCAGNMRVSSQSVALNDIYPDDLLCQSIIALPQDLVLN